MKTIGYGIVGTGYFGAELGRIMAQKEGAKIVAVYDPENGKKNVAECIIAKNRHGEIGTVELQWLGQFTSFTSQDTVHNES